jgi:hypothetical protein
MCASGTWLASTLIALSSIAGAPPGTSSALLARHGCHLAVEPARRALLMGGAAWAASLTSGSCRRAL